MAQLFKVLDGDYARECFDYDLVEGVLIWKPRPREHFTCVQAWKTSTTRWAGKPAGKAFMGNGGNTYVQVRVFYETHYAHRVIWVLNGNALRPDQEIDHIDGNGMNNRLENLRAIDPILNRRNQRLSHLSTTGVNGAHLTKYGKYAVRASLNDRNLYLGTTDTLEAAAALRKAFDLEHGFHENHGQERPR